MNYDTIASKESIEKTILALKERNITGEYVEDRAKALARIKELIPSGASVMEGASVTLEEIGFLDFLKEKKHPWNNLKEGILAEQDRAKQGLMRKQATIADYYLGSVHALSETGVMVIASNTGSQLPSIVHNTQNLILVVGAQKIVPTLEDGMKRLREYVVPLEDKHMLALYNMHTNLSKILIFEGEPSFLGRDVRVLIVGEKLGF